MNNKKSALTRSPELEKALGKRPFWAIEYGILICFILIGLGIFSTFFFESANGNSVFYEMVSLFKI